MVYVVDGHNAQEKGKGKKKKIEEVGITRAESGGQQTSEREARRGDGETGRGPPDMYLSMYLCA